MPLTFNRYGKNRVRTLRLARGGARHEVSELTLEVMLEGAFEHAFTKGQNQAVVATDTMRNIVNVLAHEHPRVDAESFAALVVRFLLDRYAAIERADVTAVETRWKRVAIDGHPHDHGFTLDGNGRPFAHVTGDRGGVRTSSGIEGFTLMKTTESGFSDFHRDEYRTLADTDDRILATSMDATWTWRRKPGDYVAGNAAVLDAMLRVFFTTYSHGVQDSMYRMGEAALANVPEIEQIRLSMPNKHYVPIDLVPFGIEARGNVFLPMDEPHGQIEAVIGRTARTP